MGIQKGMVNIVLKVITTSTVLIQLILTMYFTFPPKLRVERKYSDHKNIDVHFSTNMTVERFGKPKKVVLKMSVCSLCTSILWLCGLKSNTNNWINFVEICMQRVFKSRIYANPLQNYLKSTLILVKNLYLSKSAGV